MTSQPIRQKSIAETCAAPFRFDFYEKASAIATGQANARAKGDFYQFDLYDNWHRGDVLVPATDNHLIMILLDASLRCEFHDGTCQRAGEMATGDVAFIPAASEGRWRWSGLNQKCMHIRICKNWLVRQMSREPGAATRVEFEPVRCRNDPFMLQVGLALVDEMCAPPNSVRQLVTESAARLFGRHLLRHYSQQPFTETDSKRGGLAGWQLRRVKEAMETAETTFSLEELAAMVDISPTHFCTAFRQSTGLPPRRWQMHRRTERAKALLADPGLSLSYIAMACGYGNPSHFATSFRRITGVRPSEYRRAQ
jgi:AraC family transcriptional regulator